jgi:hypothetical protein
LKEESRLRVFENRVLRRIAVTKRDEETGEGRKLHNEELTDLYCSHNIVRVIKSRRMTLARHVSRMGKSKSCIKSFGEENMRDRHHLEDPGVDGNIILKWFLQEWERA